MLNFTESMEWIEREHCFPKDLKYFHAHRFAKMFECLPKEIRNIPSIVSVGSCGKASILSFCASIFSHLGYKCVVGVKPPLNESASGNLQRYQIWHNGSVRSMSEEEFMEQFPLLQEAVNMAEEAPELGKVAPYDMRAWLLNSWAVRQKADFIFAEANIGYLADPISVLPNTILTLVGPIGTDHGQILLAPKDFHPELEDKAGPFYHKIEPLRHKKNIVFARQDPKVENLLPEGLLYGRDFSAEDIDCSMDGSTFRLKLSKKMCEVYCVDPNIFNSQKFSLNALGSFQCENASQALVGAMTVLGTHWEDMARGLQATHISGRLQKLSDKILATVASSREKLRSLLDSLEKLLGQEEKICVCATFLDRIHSLKEAVNLLSNWPKLSTLAVTNYLNDEVNRDIHPNKIASIAPQAHLFPYAPQEAESFILRRAEERSERVLFLGNGMLSYLSLNHKRPNFVCDCAL
ncbi:hypothetical protein IJT10_06135 [bacterium]|nr:hypothetical protein [bacterium]